MEWRSSSSTFIPPRSSRLPHTSPPMPLPMTMASTCSGYSLPKITCAMLASVRSSSTREELFWCHVALPLLAQPAIHGEGLPGDREGIVARQIQCQACHLFGGSQRPCGNLGQQLLARLSCGARGLDIPRKSFLPTCSVWPRPAAHRPARALALLATTRRISSYPALSF